MEKAIYKIYMEHIKHLDKSDGEYIVLTNFYNEIVTDISNRLEKLAMQKIADLEHKNKEANEFIIEIAKMLKMETDGIGFDGIQFSLDDFQAALSNFSE